MAWNSDSNNKSLNGSFDEKALSSVGAPVAFNAGQVNRPYKDSWDIERAYREGMQKVTWVFRCIDAIASNQAKLPAMLRKDNNKQGRIVTSKNNELLELLNSKTNIGENSFIFRYRLSSQLLLSSRGAFIEKIRGRDGSLIGLQLLPPQHTSPIPDVKKFVSGYEVDMRNGQKLYLKPEDVCWVRRPHPLDPYLSITPMESAGIAIELEVLAKLYNRNYMLNDGRPGGLLVVRGDIDPDDKDELKSRFRGNLSRTGSTSVIASSDGVDYIDTSASPRDAAYIQMRQIQKEEILSAFGVPESVIGNAAGRTFSNAAEELRVFWLETMTTHLEILARALDELDEENYIDFDTSGIPILIMAKQERERYVMDEFQQGLISVNEYRDMTGRKKVDSELADSLLSNPNLTPIANTEKAFKPEEQQPVDMVGTEGAAQPGIPPIPGAPQMPQPAPPAPIPVPEPAAPAQDAALQPQQQLSESFEDMQMKQLAEFHADVETKADQDTDRWTEILDRTLERIFERQQRVVMEKVNGAKSRRALANGTFTADLVFDKDVWNRQLADDVKPILTAICNDAKSYVASRSRQSAEIDADELEQMTQDQITRMQQANQTTFEEILAATLVAQAMGDDEERSLLLRTALVAIFVNLLGKRRRAMAEHEAQSAHNAGVYLSAKDAGGRKRWVTRKDSKVRAAHAYLEGKEVDIEDGFTVAGTMLRFPGDPIAPPGLVYNCRCRLRFNFE